MLVATSAWMQHYGWIAGFQTDILADPRTLQTYGVGLALLSLLWIVARIAARTLAPRRLALSSAAEESA